MLTQILDKGKCFPVNDGGMSIGKDFPFLPGFIYPFLLLERLAERTEVCSIPCVFLPIQNAGNRCGKPVVGPFCTGTAFFAGCVPIFRGGHYTVRAQFWGNLSRSQARHAHLEDPPDDWRRWLVHDPLVLVLRVFLVAVGDIGGQRYPALPRLCMTRRTLSLVFFACHSLKRSCIGTISLTPLAVSILSMIAMYRTFSRAKSSSRS